MKRGVTALRWLLFSILKIYPLILRNKTVYDQANQTRFRGAAGRRDDCHRLYLYFDRHSAFLLQECAGQVGHGLFFGTQPLQQDNFGDRFEGCRDLC